MFQMWGKLVENNHVLQDLTVCIDDEDTRTHKVFRALDEICDAWNLAKPIWLDTNISEFKRRSKTRFTQDNFIESLEFDYLEICEDKEKKTVERVLWSAFDSETYLRCKMKLDMRNSY